MTRDQGRASYAAYPKFGSVRTEARDNWETFGRHRAGSTETGQLKQLTRIVAESSIMLHTSSLRSLKHPAQQMPLTATLNEFVLATHFDAPLPLSVVDLADWIGTFRPDFPQIQELPAAARVELTPSQEVLLNLAQPSLPRIVLRAPSQLTLQFQADRFAFGWARAEPIGQPAEYPGYETMKARWLEMLERFRVWQEARVRSRPSSRLIEIAYHNALPMEVNGRRKRISEVFRFVQPSPTRKLSSFQTSWAEQLSDAPDAPRVITQVGLGTAPPAQVVFAFNFTGLALAPKSATTSETLGTLDALHARILDMREASIISDGH
jgi:uncharacterized protein (TIGR04255 family)